ncbi:type-1 restriction enzyme EcoKI specificity protein [Lachnospiraceae bacterium]|nr:type-1 restriction enzyme EcoKI specificity protein [Lachnospiraceae bacterium]
MPRVLLKNVVARIKDKVDKDNTDLEYYIGGEHFDNGEIQITRKGVIKESTIGPAFHMRFQPGDVLLMSRNPHLRKAGVVDFEGICSDVSYVCRTKDENVLMQSFVPFIFQTDHFWKFAEENKKGSTNFFLNWSDFEKYEFDLPEFDKQSKLCEMMWAFEDTKSAYKQLLLKTDEIVKSQFIEVFGLPEKNRHNFEVGKIGDVVKDVHYGTAKKASENGKYIYIRMNNITYDGELDLTDIKRIDVPEKELAGCSVQEGDVLFNRTNSKELVGKTCYFSGNEPMIIAGYIIRLRTNGRVLPEYLSVFMNLERSKKLLYSMAKGAVGQANINAKEVQAIQLIIPPKDIQKNFLIFFRQSNKSKSELKQAIADIDNLMRTFMAQSIEKEE